MRIQKSKLFSITSGWRSLGRLLGIKKPGKGLALLLAITLILPEITWAFEPATFSVTKPRLAQEITFRIPEKLATVDKVLPGSGPLVLHIQDLHCNYEVQTNIGHLLEFIGREYGLKTVLIEGASQPINVTKLSSFPIASVREAVGEHLLRQGKISGAEYCAATANIPLQLQGIENPAYYQASQACLQKFLKEEAWGYLSDLRDALESIKPRIYSTTLSKFDYLSVQYHAGDVSWFAYCRSLRRFAEAVRFSLEPYPLFERYTRTPHGEIPLEMETEKLLHETALLGKSLRQTLYQTDEERILDERLDRLERIGKVLSISATTEDLKALRSTPEDYRIELFVRYLQEQFAKPEDLDSGVFRLDQWVKDALEFYDLADKRSNAFAENTLAYLQQQPDDAVVVLVTGGYHTPEILKQLRRARVSCASLKPRFEELDADNPYFTRLQYPATALEKLMARTREYLAPAPLFAPEVTPQQPAALVNEHLLPMDMQNSYNMVQVLLESASISRQGARKQRLSQLEKRYREEVAAYPAYNAKLEPVFDKARVLGDAVLLPFKVNSDPRYWPFVVIYPEAAALALPSYLDRMASHAMLADFYPAPMRKDIEQCLTKIDWQKKQEKLFDGFRTALGQGLARVSRPFSAMFHTVSGYARQMLARFQTRNKESRINIPALTVRPQPKFMLLAVYKELLGDFKLALGILPVLYSISPAGMQMGWMLGISGLICVVLGLSTIIANFTLARLEQGRAFKWGEIVGHIRQEVIGVKSGVKQSFTDFKKYKRFHPQASWLAVLLIIAARVFDYFTVMAHMTTLNVILPYSLVGVFLVAICISLLRSQQKTEWLEGIVSKSLQIIAAVLVVELLRFPLGLFMAVLIGSNPLVDKIDSLILRWLKKVVGIFSMSEFVFSVNGWLHRKLQDKKAGSVWENKNNSARAVSTLGTILKESYRRGHPIRQISVMLGLACLLFISLQLTMPLNVLLGIQGMAVIGMFLQWRNMVKNPQVSQKVKVMTFASLLPAALVVLSMLFGLGMIAFDQLWPQVLPAMVHSQVLQLHTVLAVAKADLLSITAFVAFVYSLLSFSSVLKDEDKVCKLSEAAPERTQVLDGLVNDYLQRCADTVQKQDRVNPALLRKVCETGQIKLVSRKMQTDWMADLIKPGIFSMGNDIYFRRRLFNLLSDQSAAALIFRERLRQTGLPAERVEKWVADITGKNIAKVDSLVALILKTDHADESRAALELELGAAYHDPVKRAHYQREALERRYGIVFPVPQGTYIKEFAGSFHALNIKLKLLQHYGIEPHPVFFRYTPERLEAALKVCRTLIKQGQSPGLKMYQTALAITPNRMQRLAREYPVRGWVRPIGWLIRLSLLLPARLRTPLERFWLYRAPVLFIRCLLPEGKSRMALHLTDRESKLGKLWARWTQDPSPARQRELVRGLVAEVEAIKDAQEQRLAIQQFSRLSGKLILWKSAYVGTLKLKGQDSQAVFMPSVLIEPKLRGVAGRYRELLRLQPDFILENRTNPKQPRRFLHSIAQMA